MGFSASRLACGVATPTVKSMRCAYKWVAAFAGTTRCIVQNLYITAPCESTTRWLAVVRRQNRFCVSRPAFSIQHSAFSSQRHSLSLTWIPACAGMTKKSRYDEPAGSITHRHVRPQTPDVRPSLNIIKQGQALHLAKGLLRGLQ